MVKAIFDIKSGIHLQVILHEMACDGQHTALRYSPKVPLPHHSPNVLYLIFKHNGSRPTNHICFTPIQKGKNSVSQYTSNHFAIQGMKSLYSLF